MTKKKIIVTEAQAEMLRMLDINQPKKILKVTKEQYERLFGELNENEKLTGHPIAGDGGSEYNPQSEEENEVTTQQFNESISEDVDTLLSLQDFATHLVQFFKNFVSNPSQDGLDPFWKKLGVTWGDFSAALIAVGFAIPMTLGTVQTIKLVGKTDFAMALKKGALKALYRILTGEKYKKPIKGESTSLGNDIELSEAGDGGYPAGAEHSSDAPYNQIDGDSEEETQYLEPAKIILPLIYYNPNEDGIAVFKYGEQLLVFISGYFNGQELEQYGQMPSPKNNDEAANDEAHVIENFINDMVLKGKIKPQKYNDKFYETNYLTVVDDNVKAFCQKVYHGDARLMDVLNGVSESTTTGSVGGAYVTPKMWANSPKDMRFANEPMYKQGKIVKNNITELEKVSLKRFVAEMDMYIYANSQEEAIVEGANIAKAVNKKWDSSARITQLKEVPYGGKISESLERKGQIEFDDCTKFNNNTEAQEGGCSVGAVDGVVKIKESLYMEVARKTGRPISEIKRIIEANFSK